MSKHRITKDERRHQDYLRRKGLKVGAVYEARLLRARAHEVKRVLEICQDYYNPEQWPLVIQDQLDETGYLPKWWNGLFADAGLPMCQSTARDLSKAKAAADRNLWLSMLLEYAARRAGESIVGVSGTLRESLIDILREELLGDPIVSIEKLTKRIFRRYQDLAKWQVRRIAQTETMIAMADAANAAAGTLDISFTKQWCISGLGNTRDSHLAMDGVEVDQDEPFTLEGGQMMYPHDTSMGALASEIINCACSCIRRPKPASAAATAPASQAPQAPQTPMPNPADAEAERTARIDKIMAEMDQSLPEETRRAIAENDLAVEEALGIKKGAPMDIDEADKQSANPKYGTEAQYGVNCATCAPAYVLRERGFDITAKGRSETKLNTLVAHGKSFDLWKNPDGSPATPTKVGDWLKKKGFDRMTKARYKKFLEESCKDRGTYILTIAWSSRMGGSGHATILKRLADGSLVNIEPQVYSSARGVKLDIVQELCDNVSYTRGFEKGVLRVDDKIFDTSWAELFNTK